MKRLLYLIFIFTISCSNYDEGDINDPCANQNKYNTIKDKFIGTLPFSDTSFSWVNFDTLKPINFTNSNGFKTIFTFKNLKNYSAEQSLFDHDSTGKFPCYNSYSIYKYGHIKKQYYNFSANNILLNYTYFRYNSIIQISKDSLNKVLGSDYFMININDVSFRFPFNQPNIGNWRFLDSIQLGTNYYKSVYEVYSDSTLVDSNVVKPAGVYYNLKVGLLGFYLNNGEKWWRY